MSGACVSTFFVCLLVWICASVCLDVQASEYVCPCVYLFVRVSTCAYFQVGDHECLWVYVLIYESVCMLCMLCVCCFDQSHSAKADK